VKSSAPRRLMSGTLDAEIKKMLAVNPGGDVGAVEMVFRAAGIGLRAAAGKCARRR